MPENCAASSVWKKNVRLCFEQTVCVASILVSKEVFLTRRLFKTRLITRVSRPVWTSLRSYEGPDDVRLTQNWKLFVSFDLIFDVNHLLLKTGVHNWLH